MSSEGVSRDHEDSYSNLLYADLGRVTRPLMPQRPPAETVVSGFNEASAAMDAGDDALYDQAVGGIAQLSNIPEPRLGE